MFDELLEVASQLGRGLAAVLEHDIGYGFEQTLIILGAPHKYPRAVIFVETLPKTATGKIKRFELRERAAVDGVLRPQ